MALLVLNPATLDIEVKVGILEEYKPNQEIEQLFQKIEQLKKELTDKMKEISGATDFLRVNTALSSDPEKHESMKRFMKIEYHNKLKQLQIEVQTINSQICPGYQQYKKESFR